jgi:hypothetical protein
MKKFLKLVMELKSWICLSFTASILIYLTVEFALAWAEEGGRLAAAWASFAGARMRCTLILQMFILCACISLLQYVFFSGRALKRLGYGLRMALFAALCFGLCLGFAAAFHWFPLENPGAWLSFAAIFLIAYVGISLGFEIYFRVMGKKYDEALGRRRRLSNGEDSVNKT